MKNLLKGLWQEDAGQDLVEYGLFLLLIGFAAIASMNTIASSLSSMFTTASTSLTTTS